MKISKMLISSGSQLLCLRLCSPRERGDEGRGTTREEGDSTRELDMCGKGLTKHGRPSLINDIQAYTSASANQPSPS